LNLEAVFSLSKCEKKVDKATWNAKTTNSQVYHRATGRAKYNRARAAIALDRRLALHGLLTEAGGIYRGFISDAARKLGVSPATIHRDLQAITRPKPVHITYYLNKEGQIVPNPRTAEVTKLLADY
jgi:hypothetical protein